MVQLRYDARTVPVDNGRPDPAPPGWYIIAMTKSEMKPTAAGTGAFMECVFDILDPQQFRGRKVFHNFNLDNPNAQAKEIAYKQLGGMMHAMGHPVCDQSEELHNKPFRARLKIKPAEGQYDARNEITGWKHVNEPHDEGGGPKPPAAGPVVPPPVAVPPAGWSPPAVAPAPAPVYAPPVAAPVAAPAGPPAGPPAWQPPAAAPAAPWAAPAASAPAPAAAPAVAPANMAPPWSPPAAPPGAAPPWATN